MTRRYRSTGEMRQDFADYARDAKKEGGMCAYGLCTGPAIHDVPDDWFGRYGGSTVCTRHAKTLGYDPDAEEWDRGGDDA